MNYGGHYRNTEENLIEQARAEDLDVIYNLIVNKEQRIPDIALLRRGCRAATRAASRSSATRSITRASGVISACCISQRYLTPDFSAYQQSALTSPYPHNGVIADLAHKQGALVGYVHPFDTVPAPERESITNAMPADVALGKADYIEVVGFADHKATAEVWYKLLNLGFRVPTGSGTDAMANYASLRGPVGMNRVYLNTGGSAEPAALHAALKEGRTFASNGPQLALEVDGKSPGDTLTLPAGGQTVRYRAALRSPVAIDHFEVVQNGRVVARHRLGEGAHAGGRVRAAQAARERLDRAAGLERRRRSADPRSLPVRHDQPGVRERRRRTDEFACGRGIFRTLAGPCDRGGRRPDRLQRRSRAPGDARLPARGAGRLRSRKRSSSDMSEPGTNNPKRPQRRRASWASGCASRWSSAT